MGFVSSVDQGKGKVGRRQPDCLFPFSLTLRTRFISFAWVAALVFLSGLVTSFLTQSTITYKKDFVVNPAGIVAAPIAQSYPNPASDFDDFQVQGGTLSKAASKFL